MKKITIILSSILCSLLLFVFSAHIFVISNPRIQIFNAIENMESPEWLENLKSDFYNINALYTLDNSDTYNDVATLNATFDLKNLQLGGDVDFSHNGEKTFGSFFSNTENTAGTIDFFEQPIFYPKDKTKTNDIPTLSTLFSNFFDNLEKGTGDHLFSAQRQNFSIFDDDLGKKTVITIEFSHHDLKSICPEEYEKVGNLNLKVKFDIVLGFASAVAYKANGEISLSNKDTTALYFNLEYNEKTDRIDLDIEILNTKNSVTNKFSYSQNNADKQSYSNITAEFNKSRKTGTASLFAEISFNKNDEDRGNGTLNIAHYDNKEQNERPINIVLPFEYYNTEDIHSLHFENFEIDYSGIKISSKFNLDISFSLNNDTIKIGIDANFNIKSIDVNLALTLNISKTDSFDKTMPKNTVLLNEEIKKRFKDAFIEQRPKTAELFGIVH